MAINNFDPTQYGAIKFDPKSLGATPTTQLPASKSPFNPNTPNNQFTDPNAKVGPVKSALQGVNNFVQSLPEATTQASGIPTAVRFGASISEVPQILRTGKATNKVYDIPGFSPFKSIQTQQSERMQAGMNPVKAGALASANVIGSGMATAGILETLKTTGGAIGDKITAANERAIQNQQQPDLKSTWEKIKPEIKTPTQVAEAAKSGELTKTKLGGIKQAIPTKGRNLEMIKEVHPYIQDASNELDIVNNLKQGISEEAQTIRQQLADSKAIWNENELKGAINQIELPNSVKSDMTLSNNFKNAKADVLKLAKSAVKTPDGLLDVRQQFDTIMENDFGPRIWNRQDGVSQVYKSFRNVLNELADSKVTDSAVKASLKKQTLLYDAIDNVAPKIKLGNFFTQFAKNNPRITKALEVGAGVIGGEAIGKKLGIIP